MHPKAQLRRFGKTALDARVAELQRMALYTASLAPEGTEERKAIKRAMTFRTTPQSIPTDQVSDRKYHKRSQVEEYNERAEITCKQSSKTDQRINSYFAAKGRIPK